MSELPLTRNACVAILIQYDNKIITIRIWKLKMNCNKSAGTYSYCAISQAILIFAMRILLLITAYMFVSAFSRLKDCLVLFSSCIAGQQAVCKLSNSNLISTTVYTPQETAYCDISNIACHWA